MSYIKKSYFEDDSDIRKKVKELEQKLDDIYGEWTASENDRDQLEQRIEALEKQIENIWAYLPSDLGEQITELKNNYVEIEAYSKANTDDITELEEHLDGHGVVYQKLGYDMQLNREVLRELHIQFENHLDSEHVFSEDSIISSHLRDNRKKLDGENAGSARQTERHRDCCNCKNNVEDLIEKCPKCSDFSEWEAQREDFIEERQGGGTAILGFENPIVVEKEDLKNLFKALEGQKIQYNIIKDVLEPFQKRYGIDE